MFAFEFLLAEDEILHFEKHISTLFGHLTDRTSNQENNRYVHLKSGIITDKSMPFIQFVLSVQIKNNYKYR